MTNTRTLTDANAKALDLIVQSEPWLVGVKPAAEVIPGLESNMILHAAPATSWEDMSEILRSGVVGAALFEGLADSADDAHARAAAGEIVFRAAQDYGAMAGGIGSIPSSLPVIVLEDRVHGNRAYHFLMEGFGRTLVLGMYDAEIEERLHWFRDELALALDAALRAIGGVDCRTLMAEALRRGDELHNRNAAATSMLAERLALGFAMARVPLDTQERAFALMQENPQFFVPVSLAAAKLALDAADGIEGSSVVTGCGANGRDAGVRVSGLPGEWFTARVEPPTGVLLDGFDDGDRGPPCGDSLLVECWALGAAVLPAAPALWPMLGVDQARAEAIIEDRRRIALGEHPHFRVPALDDRGAPTGVDVVRVVETGVRPTIDIVMVHPEPGRGVIGFGLTQPPPECFEQAVAALHARS